MKWNDNNSYFMIKLTLGFIDQWMELWMPVNLNGEFNYI